MENQMIQNIMLVDDRPENLMVLENVLEAPGRNFVKADSGEEALRLLLKNDISLILLDVQMPGIDGFETASLIRGTQRTRNIPIIFVTAISKEQKHIFKGYESGAVDYMFKPLDPDIVQRKVDIFLELDRQKRLLQVKNEELVRAKKNTDNIFSHIEEGLFLLDHDGRIKPQYSSALEYIFGEGELSGKNLTDLLQSRIEESELQSANDYLDLMFNEQIDEHAFKELNPLINVCYNRNGSADHRKFLNFSFKRIIHNADINELMVSVNDVTDRIILGEQLADKEIESQKRLELLNILQIEPQLLKEFMVQTEKEIHEIINEMEDIGHLETKESVFRAMHSLKGNASLLGLNFFANRAHQFEEKIAKVHSKSRSFKSDLLELRSILDEMLRTLTDFKSLIDDMRQFYEHFNTETKHPGELVLKAIQNLLENFSAELGKKIRFEHGGFDPGVIPAGEVLLIKDILVQLARNAIYHGVEETAERKNKNKSVTASITLSTRQENGQLVITFFDDGRGIDLDKLRKAAIASKKWAEKDVTAWKDDAVANLIFVPGISTSEKANLAAGRGMGMSIIRNKLDELSGTIDVEYEKDNFCRFVLKLPAGR